MGKFSNNWKRRNGNFLGFRSIIDIVCALEILGVVLFLVAPQFVMNYLILNPAAILHGQIWRIVTFLVYPPAITGSDAIMFVLMNALGIYCIRAFGTIVEQVWGRFRFNCYIIGGVLLHSVVAIGIYLVTGLSLPLFPTYLVYSFFFVFALMFPDMQVLLYFVIPIKIKWMAYLDIAYLAYNFIRVSGYGAWAVRMMILVSLLNFIIFFFMTRNYKTISPREIHRKQQFKKAVHPKMTPNITKHKCAICGRTENDGDDLEFRFCSKCNGNYEYCQEHLFTHTHIK